MSQFLTIREVAEQFRLSVSGVRLLIRQGRLPARRLRGGRLVRIAVEDLDRLLEPLPPRKPAQTGTTLQR